VWLLEPSGSLSRYVVPSCSFLVQFILCDNQTQHLYTSRLLQESDCKVALSDCHSTLAIFFLPLVQACHPYCGSRDPLREFNTRSYNFCRLSLLPPLSVTGMKVSLEDHPTAGESPAEDQQSISGSWLAAAGEDTAVVEIWDWQVCMPFCPLDEIRW
jgi:hypothetical protein